VALQATENHILDASRHRRLKLQPSLRDGFLYLIDRGLKGHG
jgi:hypothetical protein